MRRNGPPLPREPHPLAGEGEEKKRIWGTPPAPRRGLRPLHPREVNKACWVKGTRATNHLFWAAPAYLPRFW